MKSVLSILFIIPTLLTFTLSTLINLPKIENQSIKKETWIESKLKNMRDSL